jgi:hypothetical protein
MPAKMMRSARILWAVFAGCVLLPTAPVLAEPYIAMREGLRCSACHVNMNGGGKRTELVSTHARDLLHYPNFFGPFSNPPEFLSGDINKYVSLGADLRASGTAVFQDGKPDPDGVFRGRVSNDKVFRDRLDKARLEVTEAVGYIELRLIPDYLMLYVDQRVQPTSDNREAFGLLRGVLPWNGYVKAGRMFLPYGLQLQDDGAFIRSGTNGSNNTGFSFNQQQAAFELGFEPGPFTLVAALSDGSSNDRDLQVTTTASVLLTDLPVVRNLLLGNSFSRAGPPATGNRGSNETIVLGLFAGSNLGGLTYLGEADFRSDRSPDTQNHSVGRFIAYGEADYLLLGWLNLKAAVDYSDNDGNVHDVNDSENRVSVGLEPFLNRFLQPRLFYRVSNGIRRDPTHNQSVVLAEVHAFF